MGGFRNKLVMAGKTAIIRNNKGDVLIDADAASIFETHNIYIRARGDTTTVGARCKETGASTKVSRLVTDAPRSLVVDHINGNPLDNRRENLRVVAQVENRRNSVKPRTGITSAFKGVCKPSGRTRWHATIYNGRMIRLGTYASEVDAAKAYDHAAREIFGASAALNFPKTGEQSAHRPRPALEAARDAIDELLRRSA